MRAFNNDGGMEIQADTLKVKVLLRENREKHLKVFEEAMIGFKEASLQKLQNEVSKVRATDPKDFNENLYISLPIPKCQVDAYDTAITMLEYHTQKDITLSSMQVKSFLQDKWDWSDSFTLVNSAYVS